MSGCVYKISLGQCVLVSAYDSKLFDCTLPSGLVVRMHVLIHLKMINFIQNDSLFKRHVSLGY